MSGTYDARFRLVPRPCLEVKHEGSLTFSIGIYGADPCRINEMDGS